jgi:hypothetical protein
MAVTVKNILEERMFLQEPHGITFQKMAFFVVSYFIDKLIAWSLLVRDPTIHIQSSPRNVWHGCMSDISILMIPNSYISCKISGFHGGDYEEWRLLGCDAVWLL